MKRLLVVSLVMLGLVGCSSKFPKDGMTRIQILNNEERGTLYYLKESVTINKERPDEGLTKEIVIESYPSEPFKIKHGLQRCKYLSNNVILKCGVNRMITTTETLVYNDGQVFHNDALNEVGDLAPDSLFYEKFCK